MMAPALFAALVVTQALADGRDWASARTPRASRSRRWRPWRGASVIAVVFIAAVTTALLRAVS